MKNSQDSHKTTTKGGNNRAQGKTVATMIREAIVENGYKDVKDCARAIKVPYDLFNKVVGGHIPKDAQLLDYAKKLNIDRRELILSAYREKAPSEMKPYLNAINLLEDHNDSVKELLAIVDDCNSNQVEQLLRIAQVVHNSPREISNKALALVGLYQQLEGDMLDHFDSLILMALRNSQVSGLEDFKTAIEHAKVASQGRAARLHQ